jgi:hypothetical protein
MSYESYKPEELSGFGKRLRELASNKAIVSDAAASTIATALRDNDRCFQLVKPHERKSPKLEAILADPEKTPLQKARIRREYDILAIAGQVKAHYKTVDAFKVSSEYIYAYHILFGCSIDFLYGLTDVINPDLDIRVICEKTGLCEKAVINLMNDRIDADDQAINRIFCWSSILESSLYKELPLDWIHAKRQALRAAGTEHNLNVSNALLKMGVSKESIGSKYEPSSLEDNIGTYTAAYEGILYRLYRKLVNHIEEDILSEYQSMLEWLDDKTKKESKIQL